MADDEWAGDRVARWVRQSAGLEVQLAPVADALFEVAAVEAGASLLDVGCGTGPTTRRAAVLAGPDGRVTGLDIAGPMLAAAASIPVDEAAAPIEWLEADAVSWTPAASQYDVVLSRFGVMFFADPVRAFTNLATAARPDGRLAITTWVRRDRSPMFAVPLRATLDTLGRDGTDLPDDEGPFSLHSGDVLRGVLEPAGWTDVVVDERTITMPFAGLLAPEEAALAALDFGPTRLLTADLDEDARTKVLDAITDVFANHVDDAGHVVLDGTVLVTTAARR